MQFVEELADFHRKVIIATDDCYPDVTAFILNLLHPVTSIKMFGYKNVAIRHKTQLQRNNYLHSRVEPNHNGPLCLCEEKAPPPAWGNTCTGSFTFTAVCFAFKAAATKHGEQYNRAAGVRLYDPDVSGLFCERYT